MDGTVLYSDRTLFIDIEFEVQIIFTSQNILPLIMFQPLKNLKIILSSLGHTKTAGQTPRPYKFCQIPIYKMGIILVAPLKSSDEE